MVQNGVNQTVHGREAKQVPNTGTNTSLEGNWWEETWREQGSLPIAINTTLIITSNSFIVWFLAETSGVFKAYSRAACASSEVRWA